MPSKINPYSGEILLTELPVGIALAGRTNSDMTPSTISVVSGKLSGYSDDYFNNHYYLQVLKSIHELLTIDVAPAPADFAAGATLIGATSGKTCVVVVKLTSTTYIVKARSGTFTDGEVISDGTNSRDCGAGFPTFTGNVAPTSEIKQITDYVGSTGTFITGAFSQVVEPLDDILVLHESLVAIGEDDASNVFDSSAVTANRDGSLLERTEFLIDVLQGTQFRTERSAAGTVEENGIQQFVISLYDLDSGAIASASINITAITNVMSKSTGGGAFSSVGITQPTFAKANGTVSSSYQFLAAEWIVGDIYRLVVEGITATVDAETVYCPTMVWSNAVLEAANIDTNVETILSELSGVAGIVTFPAAADPGNGVSLAEVIRAILKSMVGSDDYDGYTNISNSANASLNAVAQKFANLFAADGINIFNPTIQGAARTDLELAFGQLATYLSDSGAAYSATVDPGGTPRTCVETTLEDLGQMLAGVNGITTFPAAADIATGVSLAEAIRAILTSIVGGDDFDGYTNISNSANVSLNAIAQKFATVIGIDAANTYAPAMFGATPATVEASFTALGTALGAEYDGTPDVYDTIVTGHDSSAITANHDGSVEERLEAVKDDFTEVIDKLESISLADSDEFDWADADGNTERWDAEYISGTEGGSADINTTAAGKLMVKIDPYATPTAAGYSVSRTQPFTSKYFTTIVDFDATFGADTTSWKDVNMQVSTGVAYDANNRICIQKQHQSAASQRFIASAWFNAVAQTQYNVSSSDNAAAFKIERWDNIWRAYYSLTQFPDYGWVLLAQYEDPSEFMDGQVSAYIGAYSPGELDAATAQGDFNNFQYYISQAGIDQQIAGDYDSSAIASDADGSVMERQEYNQVELAKIPKSDATVTWNATALASVNAEVDTALNTIVPASPTAGSVNDILSKAAGGNTFSKATDSLEMLSDKTGAFTGDGGAAQDDSVKASLDLAHTDLDTIITDTEKIYEVALGVSPVDGSLASFVATGGAALGTRLPASKSLYDGLAGGIDAVNRAAGKEQLFTKAVTSAANAAPLTLATVTTNPIWLTGLVVHSDGATTVDLTSVKVTCGASGVVTLISAESGAKANIDVQDEQVWWSGKVYLPTGATIVMTFVGTGATAVDLNAVFEYKSCVTGGYLA